MAVPVASYVQNILSWYTLWNVFESPSGTDVYPRMSPDDWQLRRNIKKCFDDGTLKLDDDEAIFSFPTKFIVETGN